MASILNDTKKMLGIPAEHTQFDSDLIMHINTVFNILQQLGVGPDEGFSISDGAAVWSDFVTDTNLNIVKSYMYAKVRMIFDPPTSGPLIGALEKVIAEMEWRLNVQVDPGEESEEFSEEEESDDGRTLPPWY